MPDITVLGNPESSCLFMNLFFCSSLFTVTPAYPHAAVKWQKRVHMWWSNGLTRQSEMTSKDAFIDSVWGSHCWHWQTHTLLSLQTNIHYSFQNDSFFALWHLAVVWLLTKGVLFLINENLQETVLTYLLWWLILHECWHGTTQFSFQHVIFLLTKN